MKGPLRAGGNDRRDLRQGEAMVGQLARRADSRTRCGIGLLLLAIALYLSSLGHSLAAESTFLGPAGAPASAFPKPDRPVADIVAPIWHSEKERDEADEPGQLARLLG